MQSPQEHNLSLTVETTKDLEESKQKAASI